MKIYKDTKPGQWTSQTPEYKAWDRMKQRCYTEGYRGKENYSGRGIVVCDEWKNDFQAFLDYVGKRPSDKHSLDRINNDGNYEPGNVRWATKHQQNANTRANNKVVGVSKRSSGRWIARLKIGGKEVLHKNVKSFEEAVEYRKNAEKQYGVAI